MGRVGFKRVTEVFSAVCDRARARKKSTMIETAITAKAHTVASTI